VAFLKEKYKKEKDIGPSSGRSNHAQAMKKKIPQGTNQASNV